MKAPAFIVSNNIYDNSVWLTPVRLNQGLLGLYALKPMSRLAFLSSPSTAARALAGQSERSEEHAREVTITASRRRFGRRRRSMWGTLDGELALFDLPLAIAIAPGAVDTSCAGTPRDLTARELHPPPDVSPPLHATIKHSANDRRLQWQITSSTTTIRGLCERHHRQQDG